MINYETCGRQAELCSFSPSIGKNVVKLFHDIAQIVNMHVYTYIKHLYVFIAYIV